MLSSHDLERLAAVGAKASLEANKREEAAILQAFPELGQPSRSVASPDSAAGRLRFIDLFAGLGGFHRALTSLGHQCVFASESDPELRELYLKNFPDIGTVHGDIRDLKGQIPKHDVLCAGFPCQPFSKSGAQRGLRDSTRGSLLHEIVDVLKKHRPPFVLLENVGNFERHDSGRTWQIVQATLGRLGYCVRGTEHVRSGGHGLISPHHLGYPHTRERFFVVASLDALPADPFPTPERTRRTTLEAIVQPKRELSSEELREVTLTGEQVRCIDHWNALLRKIPYDKPLPSFPIWGDEFSARYPFAHRTPFGCTKDELLRALRLNGRHRDLSKQQLLALLPSYARTAERQFPRWKLLFLSQNRRWAREVRPYLPNGWVRALRRFPPSHRKLEWNCQGESRDLWRCVLQFRPSGLRAKRYLSCPALVAMTTTQIPVLGPKRRFITRVEGLRLQGFPDDHLLPHTRVRAFRALGNAVHVGVARKIAENLLRRSAL